MKRPVARIMEACTLGVLTTIAVAWSLAYFTTTASRRTRQSVFIRPEYYASFGREDSWGLTQLYWRAVAENGAGRWGTPDDLCVLPSWSAARSLTGPFPPASEFSSLSQTFEVGSGWPFRSLRAEFRLRPQGAPRTVSMYTVVSGIGLPPRAVKVGTAKIFKPTALPYDPIWPGLLGSSAFYSAYWLALLVGIPVARRIHRARSGRCAGCGYDHRGLTLGSPCPECGGAVRESRSLGRWWPAIPPVAAALIIVAVAAPGLTLASEKGCTWERVMPVSLLRRQANGGSAAAVEEALRRFKAGSLSPKARERFIADALSAQADTGRRWEPRWGDLMEAAHAAGTLSQEQWQAYARNTVVLAVLPRSPVRVGDFTPFRISQEARVGNGHILGLEISSFPPSLDGVAGTIEPNPDPRYTLPPEPRPSIAQYSGQLWPRGQAEANWSIQPPDMRPGEIWAYAPVWPRAKRTGTVDFAAEFDVRIVEYAFAPGAAATTPMPRPTSTTPVVSYTVTLHAPVQVVDEGAETITLLTGDDALAKAIAENVRPITPADADRFSQGPMLERGGPGQVYAKGSFKITSLTVPVAFDIFWRSGKREWYVGSFAQMPTGAGQPRPQYRTLIKDFDAKTVDIILRPSLETARREPNMFRIWGGELVFPNIEVEPLPPHGSP